jgi:hypothetical protein
LTVRRKHFAGHASQRTTELCDRRQKKVTRCRPHKSGIT